MKLLHHDLHFLTGAYALDALEGPERERFEHHLHRCQSCSNEVRGLRETSTRLAFAVSMPPPPPMRERVLARASQTRQLPPVTEARHEVQVPLQPRARWMPRLAMGLAAAGLAVVIVLGVALAGTQHRLDVARAQENTVLAVLSARDARIVTASTNVGGSATVVVSSSLRRIVFTATGLPALPGNRVYQLWLMGPPETRSAGLLSQPSAGQTAPVLAGGLVSGDRVGVTVEPAGGTARPTTPPIVVIPLSE